MVFSAIVTLGGAVHPLLADVEAPELLEQAAAAMATTDRMITTHRVDGFKLVGFVIEPTPQCQM
jgi:hypothetical protein